MGYRIRVSGPGSASLVNLRATAPGAAAFASALGLALPRPSGPAATDGSIVVFGLGPDEWLVRTPAGEEEPWLLRLEAAAAHAFASAVLVSDAYRVFSLRGPDTLDVLAQATGVDLHPSAFPTGRATRAAFARISAIFHRTGDRPSFDLYVDRALARYAERWIEAASGGLNRKDGGR